MLVESIIFAKPFIGLKGTFGYYTNFICLNKSL